MNSMPQKEIFRLHAEVCKALSHPLRLEVIDILQEGELCFSDILEITGGLKSNLSQHLGFMVRQGIIRMRKERTCNYYRLSSVKVAKACDLMREVLTENLKKHSRYLTAMQ